MRYRDFKVTVVLNGFLIKIGCSEVVASSPEELVWLVKKYMKDPNKMEKQMLKDSFRTCDTGYGLNEGGGGGGGNTGTTTGGGGYVSTTIIPYNTPAITPYNTPPRTISVGSTGEFIPSPDTYQSGYGTAPDTSFTTVQPSASTDVAVGACGGGHPDGNTVGGRT